MTTTHTDWRPDPGDLLLVDFEPVCGVEPDGIRPALVISSPDINQLTHRVIVCPIMRDPYPASIKVILPDGLVVEGAVLVDQLRSIDKASRILRSLGTVPPDFLAEVRGKLRILLGLMV